MQRNSTEFPSQRSVPGYWWDESYSDRLPEGYADDSFVRWALPPSNWDERALNHIERHLATESEAATAYQALAKADDPAIKYLAGLIIEDEHRHHKILSRIAGTLRSYLDDTEAELQPEHAPLTPEQRAELLHETRQLLDIERSDATALKELRHDLRVAPDETMWPSLVQLMEGDTQKHIGILRGIEKHLKRGR